MQSARIVRYGGGRVLSLSRVSAYVNSSVTHSVIKPTTTANLVRCLMSGHKGGSGQVTQTGVTQLPSPSYILTNAYINKNLSTIQVEWSEGEMTEYPYVWLRDNCQCSYCFHQSALARTFKFRDLQLSVTPTKIEVSEGGGSLSVTWDNGHESTFPSAWLHQRAFTDHHRKQINDIYRVPKVFLGAELSKCVPKASFSDLLHDDKALLTFLTHLETYGVGVVTDTPKKTRQLHVLTPRVGCIIPSHYGETFHVMNKTDPSNLAYTSSVIDLHCDLPCRSSKPQIQLLHCIAQTSEGGDNLLSDAILVAEKFRKDSPHKFNILANTHVEFCDRGVDEGYEFNLAHRSPVIVLNYHGEIQTINSHAMSRTSFLDASVRDVAAWYDALMSLHEYLDSYTFQYRMNAGDILVFDNWRMMHGRTAYKATGEGSYRHLEGCYWDWPDICSKRRVLQAKLGQSVQS